MKTNIKIILFILLFSTGCNDFLDVIPDKTQQVEALFERKETARKALASCYHFLPQLDGVYSNFSFASDELITTTLHKDIPGRDIIRGKQSKSQPLLAYWDNFWGIYTQESLFRGIRYCNTFIENIDRVNDMTEKEKKVWKAEVIFLKAYYHFLLFSQYGPIPIIDINLPIDSEISDIRVKRKDVDAVVTYIVNTIDEAMKDLPTRITLSNDLGRIDKVIAASIKSRVLLYAASPLFNGNSEYYNSFSDKDGQKLFNSTYDKEKWKLAADAAKEAIDLALENGVKIYEYDSIRTPLNDYDKELFKHKEIKAMYNYRFVMVDSWNSELIWGNSSPVLRDGSWWSIQAAAFPMNPTSSTNEASWNWAVPTIDIVEAYYTVNGLPIDEDKTFDYDKRYANQRVMQTDSLFCKYREIIPRLHQNREPRFYASIGFDRGFYRIWGEKWELQMRFGEKNGRKTLGTKDYSITGYLLKKVCHPNSEGSAYDRLKAYPWPIIRLSELYLNYAEAMNEYNGPSQEIYDALNEIRRRVNIPDIEVVWSDANLAKTVSKHTNKDGLREIIHQERRIELAFEGNRNYDVRRWKEGAKYFGVEAKGWTVDGTNSTDYYKLKTIMQRSFITPRDYLFPIHHEEIIRNSNLVQNPGW